MELSERQLQLVKKLLADVGDSLEGLPFEVGAERCEAVSAVLIMIGATEAAEAARHYSLILREGKASREELKRVLHALLEQVG